MGTDVSLSIDELKAKLSNGLITVEFDENAMVTSLIKNNMELVTNLNGSERDPDRKHTFYVDYHAEGKFHNISVAKLDVIKNTPEEAHIQYVDNTGLLYVEYHIILKRGESGLYSYVVARNNLQKEFKLSEFRTVYRLNSKLFEYAYNSERIGKQPTCEYLSKFPKIQDETYELPDGELYTNGKVYSKYDYAGYYRDNPFWGQFGNGFGFWFIPVSTEYYPSGPLKQELLVHYDAIILNYMTGAHFGTGDFYVPPQWEKLYGPWYVYVNTGEDEVVLRDAAKQAKLEESKWPYQWMTERLYPTKRATVTGKLSISHNRSSEGAMIVLAQPGGDFIRQKSDYIYYTQADTNGEFTLPHVRPGNYTLYAYATKGDITDEYFHDGIVVGKGNVELGTIQWEPPFRTKVWQIGQADRTAADYKFGGKLRNYKWHCMVPENVEYMIGTSKEKEDWYYAQTKPGCWNIRFSLDDSAKRYYLTIAIASATKGKIDGNEDLGLTIKVNGTSIKTLTYPSDTTIYRSATQSGWYHQEKIELGSKELVNGDNVITLQNNNSAIMYDTILLECD